MLFVAQIAEYIAIVLMIIGAIFSFSGTVGLLRFPDFYTRIHSLGLNDSFGAPVMLVGLSFDIGLNIITLKIILLIIIMMITGALGTHILAKSAYRSGVMPKNLC